MEGFVSNFPRDDYLPLKRYSSVRAGVELDLSDNANLWGPHPASVEAVLSSPPEAFHRYPSLYSDDLRDQVAEKFGISPDCVTTGCGSDDVLDSAIRASGHRPGLVTYASPTFVMAEVFSRLNGLETRRTPWPEALAQPGLLLESNPCAVYVCSPNNPTGAPLPDGWLEDFLALCGPAGPLVILDEAYAQFEGRSHARLAVDHGRILVAHTLSKLYALAGVRVGYGIGRADVIEEIEKSRGPYKVSAISERAAVAALSDESGWLERVVSEVRRNRDRLASELTNRGLEPLPSVTNFLLVPTPSRPVGEIQAGLLERSVSVRPFPGLEGIGDAFRTTVGPWPLMEGLLSALDEVLAT